MNVLAQAGSVTSMLYALTHLVASPVNARGVMKEMELFVPVHNNVCVKSVRMLFVCNNVCKSLT